MTVRHEPSSKNALLQAERDFAMQLEHGPVCYTYQPWHTVQTKTNHCIGMRLASNKNLEEQRRVP